MTREEYLKKSGNDKKTLIVKFFNQMSEGTILLFVSLFEFWSLITVISVSPVFKFIEFSSVSGLLSSVSVKFCSVSVVLLAAELLLEVSEILESVSEDSLSSIKYGS